MGKALFILICSFYSFLSSSTFFRSSDAVPSLLRGQGSGWSHTWQMWLDQMSWAQEIPQNKTVIPYAGNEGRVTYQQITDITPEISAQPRTLGDAMK